MQDTTGARRRIAVVGGGIGGLAFAGLAAGQGHEVVVFESAPEVRAQGSGFVVQPGGQAVLDVLGLWGNVGGRGERVDRILGVDQRDGRTAIEVSLRNPALRGYAVERAGLVGLLVQAALAAGATIQTGKRVVSVEQGTLVFEDGEVSGPWDGVVDASGGGGMSSPMKAALLPYGAYWATVPWVDGVEGIPRQQLTQRYQGTRRMVGLLPLGENLMGQQVAAFFWSVRLQDAVAIRERGFEAWKEECLALWPEIAPFVAPLQAWDDVRLACYSHGRLRRPVEPGLIRIGDAAHRTSPQLGQGANMALLDAWALAAALEGARSWDEATALAVRARRTHVAFYHMASGLFTAQYQSDRDWLAWVRNRALGPLGKVFPAPLILERLTAGSLFGSAVRR